MFKNKFSFFRWTEARHRIHDWAAQVVRRLGKGHGAGSRDESLPWREDLLHLEPTEKVKERGEKKKNTERKTEKKGKMRITSYCRSNTKVKKRNDLMNASKNSNAKGSIYSITFFFLIYNIIIIVVYRNDDINGSSGFF